MGVLLFYLVSAAPHPIFSLYYLAEGRNLKVDPFQENKKFDNKPLTEHIPAKHIPS